jgi:hypothetical protein
MAIKWWVDIAGVNAPGNNNRFVREEGQKYASTTQEGLAVIVDAFWEKR